MIEYGLIGSNVENSFSKLIHESFKKIHYELVSLKTEKDIFSSKYTDYMNHKESSKQDTIIGN